MHYGKLEKSGTHANRLYERLKSCEGVWQSCLGLQMTCGCLNVSSRISEVRAQLPGEWRLEKRVERDGRTGSRVTSYRLVRCVAA